MSKLGLMVSYQLSEDLLKGLHMKIAHICVYKLDVTHSHSLKSDVT